MVVIIHTAHQYKSKYFVKFGRERGARGAGRGGSGGRGGAGDRIDCPPSYTRIPATSRMDEREIISVRRERESAREKRKMMIKLLYTSSPNEL